MLILQFLTWPTQRQLQDVQVMVRRAQSQEPYQDTFVSLPGRAIEKLDQPCNSSVLRQELDPSLLTVLDYHPDLGDKNFPEHSGYFAYQC